VLPAKRVVAEPEPVAAVAATSTEETGGEA
jgi:hypothetical protein